LKPDGVAPTALQEIDGPMNDKSSRDARPVKPILFRPETQIQSVQTTDSRFERRSASTSVACSTVAETK